jgi:hypothetical protein
MNSKQDQPKKRLGRPVTKPEGTKNHTVNLSPDTWEYLSNTGNVSLEITRLVDQEKEKINQ